MTYDPLALQVIIVICEILQRRTGLWIKKADGKIRLILSSPSEYELTGWVLSFADEAKVVKPKWLVKKVSQTIKKMEKVYS